MARLPQCSYTSSKDFLHCIHQLQGKPAKVGIIFHKSTISSWVGRKKNFVPMHDVQSSDRDDLWAVLCKLQIHTLCSYTVLLKDCPSVLTHTLFIRHVHVCRSNDGLSWDVRFRRQTSIFLFTNKVRSKVPGRGNRVLSVQLMLTQFQSTRLHSPFPRFRLGGSASNPHNCMHTHTLLGDIRGLCSPPCIPLQKLGSEVCAVLPRSELCT